MPNLANFHFEAREASASWQSCFNNLEPEGPLVELHATHLATPDCLRKKILISRAPRQTGPFARLAVIVLFARRQSWQKQLFGDEVVGKGMGGDVKRAARMA